MGKGAHNEEHMIAQHTDGPAVLIPSTARIKSKAATEVNSSSSVGPSKEELTSYDRDGFLHAKNFFNAKEVEELRRYVTELQNEPEEAGGTCMYFEESSTTGERILNRMEDFCRNHEGMCKTFQEGSESKLMQFSEKLLGSEPFSSKIRSILSWQVAVVSRPIRIKPPAGENTLSGSVRSQFSWTSRRSKMAAWR